MLLPAGVPCPCAGGEVHRLEQASEVEMQEYLAHACNVGLLLLHQPLQLLDLLALELLIHGQQPTVLNLVGRWTGEWVSRLGNATTVEVI